MTDNELLRLAAKAAGLIILREESDCMLISSDGCRTGYHWNPLSEDGDALRLAVKLGMQVDVSPADAFVGWGRPKHGFHQRGAELRELFADDPFTATRRAIVRAAAEIGKAA